MNQKEAIEIPFGAFNSELKGWEYTIPEGMEAEIKDGKIIIREKESEDERMRNFLIGKFREIGEVWHEYSTKDIIAWLEKQGNKAFSVERVFAEAGIKPAYNDGNSWCVLIGENIQEGIYGFGETPKDAYVNFLKELWNRAFQTPVHLKPEFKPKFKVGDFVLHGKKNIIFQVEKTFLDGTYRIVPIDADKGKAVTSATEDTLRLWTIQDAKDGDVLYTPKGLGVEGIFLIGGWKQVDCTGRTLCSLIGYRVEDDEITTGGIGAIWWEGVIDPFFPATKEQRELLFQKMKEAGYEWNADKKELVKIEQNPAWSVEDKIGFCDAMWAIGQARTIAKDENDMGNLWNAEKWLKSFKDRYTWKPSDEQMKCLLNAEGVLRADNRIAMAQKLSSLYNDLKALCDK